MNPIRVLLALFAAAAILGCGAPRPDAVQADQAPATSEPESVPVEAVTLNCPVMPSMEVDVAQAVAEGRFVDHEGRRFVFCCPGCPEVFKKNPERYAEAESIPIPEEPAG